MTSLPVALGICSSRQHLANRSLPHLGLLGASPPLLGAPSQSLCSSSSSLRTSGMYLGSSRNALQSSRSVSPAQTPCSASSVVSSVVHLASSPEWGWHLPLSTPVNRLLISTPEPAAPRVFPLSINGRFILYAVNPKALGFTLYSFCHSSARPGSSAFLCGLSHAPPLLS